MIKHSIKDFMYDEVAYTKYFKRRKLLEINKLNRVRWKLFLKGLDSNNIEQSHEKVLVYKRK